MVQYFLSCGETDYTESGHSKIRAGSERSTIGAILGAKIDFLVCFFLKHELNLILPMMSQKKSEKC
jgi:hypothetical protein